jgi:hypothetical protein
VTKLRAHAAAIAFAGLLALFGTACTQDSGTTEPSEPAGDASAPAAESSEMAS